MFSINTFHVLKVQFSFKYQNRIAFFSLIKKMSKPFHLLKYLFTKIVKHYESLCTVDSFLSIVKDGQELYRVGKDHLLSVSTKSSTAAQFHFNKNYLFPQLLILYVAMDALRVFHCNDYHYYTIIMPIERTFYSQYIFPRQLWQITDIPMISLIVGPLVAYFFLIFDRPIDNKNLLFIYTDCDTVSIVQNGKIISRSETEKLADFYSKAKRSLPLVISGLFLTVDVFSLFNFFSNHWTGSVYSYFVLVNLNFFIFYSVNSKKSLILALLNFFILCSRPFHVLLLFHDFPLYSPKTAIQNTAVWSSRKENI